MARAPLAEVPVTWTPCHRLIASRYPTASLFDDIAAPADLEAVLAIESLTNPRVRQEFGDLSLVPAAQRVVGPGATLIMAAFTHLNPLGSRFSDGSYGVYYAAESLDTAVSEVSFHRGRFLARTAEPEIDLDLRWIQADVNERLVELRGLRRSWPRVYDANDYAGGQTLGRRLRSRGGAGLVYESVRRRDGQCVALFRPTALSHARPAGHIALHWDGQRITHWYGKGEPRRI